MKSRFPRSQKIEFFPNRFFDVLAVAKGRRRLEFWQRVALDFPDVPRRPNDERNRVSSTNFRENFENFSKFSRKIAEKIRFWSSFGRSGSSGKSRATRRQNSSLLRRLATTKTSKKRFRKRSIFWGFGNQFFVIFPGFLRELTIVGAKINFLVKFCSRYTYSEVRATKNHEKTICAARTWPPRALPARAQSHM